MNQDQFNSLVRSALKIGGAFLVSKGYADAGGLLNAPGFIGVVLAFAGFLWSHFEHDNFNPNPPKPGGGVILAFLLAGLLCLLLTGCQSTPQAIAYQAAGTTIASVDESMKFWGDYVATAQPPASVELRVKSAYEKYQAAALAVCDAGAIYAATGTTNAAAAAAFNQAIAESSQALTDLQTLVSAYHFKP